MFVQTKSTGINEKKKAADFEKLVKQYLLMGCTQKEAESQAESIITYYQHAYRCYE
ncbi:MAG: hypothetical protein LBS33_03085 [Streptococcaceae bacterium]|jgi:hypothetical protein|nr:hypothetical protein [Streptococcaceae bacterium]